jgi:von Willebrand factor type A domain
MELAFLTPLAGLVAFAVILPLVAFVRSEQRSARVRSLLRLGPPGGSHRQTIAAIVALAVLVGLGAAQPILEQTREHSARTDAQAFVLLDTSRSMLASASGGETRFARAAAAARRFRESLPGLPMGVASLTDRVLPLVFPSANPDTFERVLRHSVAVDKPASREANNTRASALDATGIVPRRSFFRGPQRRLLVVLTDAETQRLHPRRLQAQFSGSGIETVLVRIGDPSERIVSASGEVELYTPDPASAVAAEQYAAAVGGRAFSEDELDEAINAARDAIGTGRTTLRIEASDVRPLGPFVFLAALVPLAFLLWRRNLAFT